MSNVPKLRLRYFPFPGRAGPIRDTLQIGGIDFEDEHIPPAQFRERRAAGEFPFGGLPVMDVETDAGKFCVSQSNAILRYAGRLTGLYPERDPLLALKVDEALGMGEDVSQSLSPTFHEQDNERKMAMRKVLAEETLPYWADCFERLLQANGGNGFIVGNDLTVADLKLYWIIDFLTNGSLDGIPTSLVDGYPGITAWRQRVSAEREARLAQAGQARAASV